MDERKVIQMIGGMDRDGNEMIRVLCSDGTMWEWAFSRSEAGKNSTWEWQQMPGVPHE